VGRLQDVSPKANLKQKEDFDKWTPHKVAEGEGNPSPVKVYQKQLEQLTCKMENCTRRRGTTCLTKKKKNPAGDLNSSSSEKRDRNSDRAKFKLRKKEKKLEIGKESRTTFN